MGRCMYGWMEVKAVLRIEEAVQKLVPGWMDRWMDGWMDVWVDGWK